MTATQIIEIARDQLPLTSEVEQPTYQIAVQNENQFDIWMMCNCPDMPTEYDIPVYIVEFRKQRVGGVIIGWEFVDITK